MDDRAFARLVTPQTCSVDGRWKPLARGEHEELYDLTADPLEEHPLDPGSAPNAPLASLRAAIAGARQREVSPAVGSNGGARDNDLESQLQLLGYL